MPDGDVVGCAANGALCRTAPGARKECYSLRGTLSGTRGDVGVETRSWWVGSPAPGSPSGGAPAGAAWLVLSKSVSCRSARIDSVVPPRPGASNGAVVG